MNGRTHRIVVLFGLAVACAVALAGGAQAATRPDDRGGSIGVGATQADVDAHVFNGGLRSRLVPPTRAA